MNKPGRYWIRGELFTLCLVVLIVGAAGGGLGIFLFIMLGVIFGGVVSFYLLFPGSYFFSISLANCLAVYSCLYVFLVETNFQKAGSAAIQTGFALPVVAFIAGALLRRQQVREIVQSGRLSQGADAAKGWVWLVPFLAVAAASFAVPQLGLTAGEVDLALLAAMVVIALIVLLLSPTVSSFLLDSGLVFEQFFARIGRVFVPAFAFLTYYTLIVIVFACLYRLIDLYVPGAHFNFNGAPHEISFSESLYFSIVSLSTLGYGDIAPVSGLVRALIAIEVVVGVLLLLFGFSEIMRYSLERDDAGRDGDGKA